MKADPEDRVNPKAQGKRFPLPHLLVALGILAAVLWFSVSGGGDKPAAPIAVPEEPPQVVEPEPLPAPDIPEPVQPEPAVPSAQAPPVVSEPPLPALEASDEALREQLSGIATQPQIEKLLRGDNLVQRSTGFINALSRGQVVKKLLPFAHPGAKFSVTRDAENLYMDPAGYHRYDSTVAALISVDNSLLVAAFHRFRPLFEQAYGELGLEPAAFDNAVIRTLDLILSSEEIEGRIPLQRKSVMYTYADPRLEKLPPLKKQLLRMGPDNTRLIKQYAQALRDALLLEH